MPKTSLHVDVTRPSFPVSRDLYGLFFEEINHAGDGGLYSERIRNRSFCDALIPAGCRLHEVAGSRKTLRSPQGFETTMPDDELPGWTLLCSGHRTGQMSADDLVFLSSHNPRSVRLEVSAGKEGYVGICNEGYWGIPAHQGEACQVTVWTRSHTPSTRWRVKIIDSKENTLAESGLTDSSDRTVDSAWIRYQASLTPSLTDPQCRLVIETNSPGIHHIGFVSLVPTDAPLFRRDLLAHLKALKPSFLRFPGGCFVEGFTCETAYDWKSTLGPVHERQGHWNLWHYRSTNGLGFHEYLLLCEELGADAMYVANCGMTCQARRGGALGESETERFLQDALDAVEYAMGPADSFWGAKRVAAGHPDPFRLKYLEIGNENSGPEYEIRYRKFYATLKNQYPPLQLIVNIKMDNAPMEIIDEHFYANHAYFHSLSSVYDRADRRGPKIYVGEYAVVGTPSACGHGDLRGAVGEAAFLTGLERNADVVCMASYAPLFVNVHDRSWNPDLIQFDNSRSCVIPSYHVQKMFSENRGDTVLPIRLDCSKCTHLARGGVGFVTWEAGAEFRHLQVVAPDGKILYTNSLDQSLDGLVPFSGDWQIIDGALRQTGFQQNATCLLAHNEWEEYTVTCQARLRGDGNGFMLAFHAQDAGHYARWQFGWNNAQTGVEQVVNGGPSLLTQLKPHTIESGRWYHLKIIVSQGKVRCELDGEFVHEAYALSWPDASACATRDDSTGEIILKLVNALDKEQEIDIHLDGLERLSPEGIEIQLTHPDPRAENTLENPENVRPVTRTVSGLSSNMTRLLPPCSVTVLKLKG